MSQHLPRTFNRSVQFAKGLRHAEAQTFNKLNFSRGNKELVFCIIHIFA